MEKARVPGDAVVQPAPVALVRKQEIEAQWDEHAIASPDPRTLRGNRIVTFDHSEPAGEAFDMLRTKAMQRMQQNGWSSLGITSPDAGCGSSVVALNLAFSMAGQEDCRVLLVDLNLRRPKIATLMGIETAMPLEAMLTGQLPVRRAVQRCGRNLALALNGCAVERPAELLQSTRAQRSLEALIIATAPRIVIYDMPPLRPNDDAISFLHNVDCALLVLEAERTTGAQADECEFELSQATGFLGVVFNKCRYPVDAFGQ